MQRPTLKSSKPHHRIWMLAATISVVAGGLLAATEFPTPETPVSIDWWVLIPAFLATEVFVIHLPTRRSAHTVSVSEIPMVIGLAFVSPPLFIAARMIGTVIAYVGIRRQRSLKLTFNMSLLLLETTVAAIAYHAVLGGREAISPRGWLASTVAIAVAVTLGGLLVSIAISAHDREASIWARRRDLASGFVISMLAGVVAILWVIVIWHDVGAVFLLVITSIPVFLALRVYERLARRHDELGMAHALTKELDDRHTWEEVSISGLERVVHTLKPSAAAVIMPRGDHVTFFDEDDASLHVHPHWKETLRYHRDVCPDGGPCACARRMLGGEWDNAMCYRLVVGAEVHGMLVVRPRTGAGTEISSADHGMLEAIAAQLSSAMTRIEAVSRLTREIEEKQTLVRSKDQLIASVSHELRTPLTGIIGFAELLAEGGDSLTAAEIEHAKQYIANEAHDLGNIVEDLLTAARADLGALEVQAKPVSTSTVVARALSHLHTDRTIEVIGPDCWLSGDAPRIRQILRNLLSNAVKYGGERIQVSAERSGQDVVIRVVDDGAGIPEDRLDSIFEPYESAHDEPSQPGSLGLGLSIARTLARLMGGELTHHQTVARTEFRLRLPALANAPHAELVG